MTGVAAAIRILEATLRLLIALLGYTATKRTPFYPYLGMRRLHALTRGASSRALSAAITALDRPAPLETVDGILGKVEPDEAERLAQRIRQDGFVVFDALLEPTLCEDLEKFARSTPARTTPAPPGGEEQVYDPLAPVATRYDIAQARLLRFPPVQRIAVDASLRSVAQAYLEATPVNDMMAMWWTVAHGEVSSEAAQMFHYDLDRLRFLKFFIYLSDVTEKTGPHVYVRGSHLGRPRRFFEDRRFTDEEVADVFTGDAIRELGGPRGTIMAVDTSGLHKGKHPDTGDRLILQLEFSVSLFGVGYETLPARELLPEVAAEVRRFPRTYRRFRA